MQTLVEILRASLQSQIHALKEKISSLLGEAENGDCEITPEARQARVLEFLSTNVRENTLQDVLAMLEVAEKTAPKDVYVVVAFDVHLAGGCLHKQVAYMAACTEWPLPKRIERELDKHLWKEGSNPFGEEFIGGGPPALHHFHLSAGGRKEIYIYHTLLNQEFDLQRVICLLAGRDY